MKKHIVILVGSYYPNYSAVGICAKNVVDELKKEVHVSVIAQKTTYSDDGHVFFEGYDLYRISDQLHSIYLKYPNSILSYAVRCIRYVRSLLQKVNIGWNWVKAYHEKLEELAQNREIDTIVCFSFPFESVVAGVQYKKESNPNVKIIPFLMDRFSSSSSLHRTKWNYRIKKNNHLSLEKYLFEQSYRILYLQSWENDIEKYCQIIKRKCVQTEHPLLKPLSNNFSVNYDKTKINIAYTGSLIQDIRNPEYTIKLFSIILKLNINIVLHFYIRGNCDFMINYFATQFPNQVRNYGGVATTVAHDVLQNADMLLSIGNADAIQIASKVFEYLSSGKPIIHISKKHDDPVNKILSFYGNAAIIMESISDSILDNAMSVMGFIQANRDNKKSFQYISEIYPEALPVHSAQLILNS
jgi:glycosyltransferase involved in cell wall biosynthesis